MGTTSFIYDPPEDCGLWIADCGLWVRPSRRPLIHNPQFELRAVAPLYTIVRTSASRMIAAMAALAGKVALVLGGTGEVGEGITRALLAAGAIVAVSSRDNNRLSELHDRLAGGWEGREGPIT